MGVQQISIFWGTAPGLYAYFLVKEDGLTGPYVKIHIE